MSDLLTIPEAALRRGCSEKAIQHAIGWGTLEPYDSADGTRYVWADEVDELNEPRHLNRSSGEPLLRVADVPGDDDAIRQGFNVLEIRLMSLCLDFTFFRGRLHIHEKPIVAGLMRRFHRIKTTRSRST